MVLLRKALFVLGTSFLVLISSLVQEGVSSASPSSTIEPCAYAQGLTCTRTIASVNMRAQPNTESSIIINIASGTVVALGCWAGGESINGDNIWYEVERDEDYPVGPMGFVSGYWLDTGKDPLQSLRAC